MRVYEPDGAVLIDFLEDRSPVSLIQGPIMSGKSVDAQIKIWMLAHEQEPDPDGIRRTRWLMVRNTYNELRTTTLKTHLDWFPMSEFGEFALQSRPITRIIRHGDVEIEYWFLALDRPDDVHKLRSLEVTGAYVNEVQYIDMSILTEIKTRCNRYPRYDPQAGYPGATWAGVIGDLNAPSSIHWVPMITGEVPIPSWLDKDTREAVESAKAAVESGEWKVFVQPPGLVEVLDSDNKVIGYEENPLAENAKFRKESYKNKKKGKSKAWVDSNIMNRSGSDTSGKPIYPRFNRDHHVAREPIAPNEDVPIWIGLDYGRTPACIIAQRYGGRWFALEELYVEGVGATTFAPMVKAALFERYSFAMAPNGPGVLPWGDPAGAKAGEASELTPQQVFHTNGIFVRPALGAIRHASRKEPVEKLLDQSLEGRPVLTFSPNCSMLVEGMQGGYVWKEGGTEEPEKNAFSHVVEAFEYMIYGSGEGRKMQLGNKRKKPIKMPVNRGLFSHEKQNRYKRY